MKRFAFLPAAKIALVSFCSFVAVQTHAQSTQIKNPMQRACVAKGGEIENIKVSTSEIELSFCKFDAAYVGSENFLLIESEAMPMAIAAYLKDDSASATATCDSTGNLAVGQTYSGVSFAFCTYSDGSRIELQTLKNGPKDPKNQKLNQALGN